MNLQVPMTRAAQLAAQYENSQDSALPTDPALNPAWHNRERVPSPPRRDGSPPKVLEAGLDPIGRTGFTITEPVTGTADRGGDTPPTAEEFGEDAFLQSCREELYVPPAVQTSPTFTRLTNPESKPTGADLKSDQDHVDKAALNAAAQISRLVASAPDEAMKAFRITVNHPMTGFLVFGHLTEAVQKDISSVFFKIIIRKPWVFQICRMLLALQGNTSLPKLFRSCCSLATNHAFLAYADIVSPYGHLEDIAHDREETALTASLNKEQADIDELNDSLTSRFNALTDDPEAPFTLDGIASGGLHTESNDSFKDAMGLLKAVYGPPAEDEVDESADDSELEAMEEDEEEFLTEDEIAALTEDELDELTRPEPPVSEEGSG